MQTAHFSWLEKNCRLGTYDLYLIRQFSPLSFVFAMKLVICVDIREEAREILLRSSAMAKPPVFGDVPKHIERQVLDPFDLSMVSTFDSYMILQLKCLNL